MSDKVTEIFLERLMKQIEESGRLPWERPFSELYAFNYFSMREYTGINRWILPPGEYMTANQINSYNREHGTNFRFSKGIKWYPVFFVKDTQTEISESSLPSDIKEAGQTKEGYLGRDSSNNWYVKSEGKYYKCKKVRRFYQVADRSFFIDETGNTLPSRVANGEVVMTYTKPNEIIDNYLGRESNIRVTHTPGEAYYCCSGDIVNVPDIQYFNSEVRFYSTWFHELVHSTGADSRLCRVGVALSKRDERDKANKESDTKKYVYSMEECIAELGCALLCSESGFQSESLSDEAYKNHVAYVQSWMKYFKDNKDDIIWVMSCAEKAYRYVLYGDNSMSDVGTAPMRKE